MTSRQTHDGQWPNTRRRSGVRVASIRWRMVCALQQQLLDRQEYSPAVSRSISRSKLANLDLLLKLADEHWVGCTGPCSPPLTAKVPCVRVFSLCQARVERRAALKAPPLKAPQFVFTLKIKSKQMVRK